MAIGEFVPFVPGEAPGSWRARKMHPALAALEGERRPAPEARDPGADPG
ncbi:MAG: hypothetical protein QOJ91_386 [Sphingomonadales bacterium]|jgi:hypothetical protein|nr:hypothetical protein [Sphingomonadales bacterium]